LGAHLSGGGAITGPVRRGAQWAAHPRHGHRGTDGYRPGAAARGARARASCRGRAGGGGGSRGRGAVRCRRARVAGGGAGHAGYRRRRQPRDEQPADGLAATQPGIAGAGVGRHGGSELLPVLGGRPRRGAGGRPC